MKKKLYVRLATLRNHVTESQDWRIRMLADYGFSYKTIAFKVFGKRSEYQTVGRILSYYHMRVRDYRDAVNTEGRGVLIQCLQKK